MEIIGTLMIEHKLIKRMVALIEHEFAKIKSDVVPNTAFIEEAIDFFRMYADQWHHGKEEDILFKALAKKELAVEHKKIMDQLIAEHKTARGFVKQLAEANKKYLSGKNKEAINDICKYLDLMLKLYPQHIETEDEHFFVPIMDYFNVQEKQRMQKERDKFDAQIDKEKYKKLVIDLSEKSALY